MNQEEQKSKVFAFNFQERVEPAEIAGSYDDKLDQWIGGPNGPLGSQTSITYSTGYQTYNSCVQNYVTGGNQQDSRQVPDWVGDQMIDSRPDC